MEHEEEYEKMNMAEKSWTEVSFGYFVPLSNKGMTLHELLDDYSGRTEMAGENRAVTEMKKNYHETVTARKERRIFINMANNCNQIARRINTEGVNPQTVAAVEQLLEEIQNQKKQ